MPLVVRIVHRTSGSDEDVLDAVELEKTVCVFMVVCWAEEDVIAVEFEIDVEFGKDSIAAFASKISRTRTPHGDIIMCTDILSDHQERTS
jgi:hypothetical protein